MRVDAESDWPSRLINELVDAPVIDENVQLPRYMSWTTNPELTNKEVEVLKVLSHGLTIPMASFLLQKSINTINAQLQSARCKLRAKDTTHAVAIAIRKGIID